MFCHHCGKPIPDGVNFCGYCGTAQTRFNAPAASTAVYGAGGSPAWGAGVQVAQPPVQPPVQPSGYTSQQPAVPVRPQPAPLQPQSVPAQPQPVPAASGGAMLASHSCIYKVAMESEFKKFEFGGMPEGTVEIYEDRLELYKKSKMVRLAFGAIGSALSGKGKPDVTISAHMVRRDTVTDQKNAFRFYLTDGQLAFVQFSGVTEKTDCRNAMLRFLKKE